jgi:hypothetical protein
MVSYLYDVVKPLKSIFFLFFVQQRGYYPGGYAPKKLSILHLAPTTIFLKMIKIQQGSCIMPESLL